MKSIWFLFCALEYTKHKESKINAKSVLMQDYYGQCWRDLVVQSGSDNQSQAWRARTGFWPPISSILRTPGDSGLVSLRCLCFCLFGFILNKLPGKAKVRSAIADEETAEENEGKQLTPSMPLDKEEKGKRGHITSGSSTWSTISDMDHMCVCTHIHTRVQF